MNLDALKVSIKELKQAKNKKEVTVLKFSNVDVNVKTYYLQKLKDPIKYVKYLWHKKTETQIRRLAKEDYRYNEMIGLARLQKKMGYDITHATASLLEQKEEEADVFTELMRSIEEREAGAEYNLIISETDNGFRIDNI